MNYQKHYNLLIEKAQKRKIIDGYFERHHIIPKCLGGDNDKSNIVKLTGEEHYVAHLLLINIYPGNKSLIWSAMAMTNKTKNMPRNNKSYGWLRREFIKVIKQTHKGRKASNEARMKMSNARKGKKFGPHSLKTRMKMSLVAKGKPKSKAHKEAMSKARIGIKLKPHTPETKQKQSIGIRLALKKLGRMKYFDDPNYKKLQSEKMKEIWDKRKSGILVRPNHKKNECVSEIQ